MNSVGLVVESISIDQVCAYSNRGISQKGSTNKFKNRIFRYEIRRHLGDRVADWLPEDEDIVEDSRLGCNTLLASDSTLLQEDRQDHGQALFEAQDDNRPFPCLTTGQTLGVYQDPMTRIPQDQSSVTAEGTDTLNSTSSARPPAHPMPQNFMQSQAQSTQYPNTSTHNHVANWANYFSSIEISQPVGHGVIPTISTASMFITTVVTSSNTTCPSATHVTTIFYPLPAHNVGITVSTSRPAPRSFIPYPTPTPCACTCVHSHIPPTSYSYNPYNYSQPAPKTLPPSFHPAESAMPQSQSPIFGHLAIPVYTNPYRSTMDDSIFYKQKQTSQIFANWHISFPGDRKKDPKSFLNNLQG